jgi:HlyD family secretion protein
MITEEKKEIYREINHAERPGGTRPATVGPPPTRRGPAPKTRRRRPAWVRPTAWFLLAASLVFLGVTLWRARQTAAAPKPLYRVTAAEEGPLKKTVSATGTLQPWSVVDIKSKAGGRIDLLSVEVGDKVTAGQVLARIDPADTMLTVKTAQADIEAAQARAQQSVRQYQLQVTQSASAIRNAGSQAAAARAALAAAEVRLKTARQQANAQPGVTGAAISAAQANVDSATEQRRQLDATQTQARAEAQASLDQAVANERNARQTLDRQKALLEKGFVAAQTVDQAQTAYDVAKAQLTSAQSRLRTLDGSQKAEQRAADARVAQAKAQLTSARSQSVEIASRNNAVAEAQSAVVQAREQVQQAEQNLAQARSNQANDQIKNLDIRAAQATIARAEATLENANDTLTQTTVRAPSAGVVLQKYVEQGTIITSGQSLSATGTSLVQIGDISKMYANVSVDETDIARVEAGQAVDVRVDAFPGITFAGKVARLDPQAVVTNNVTTFNVRVEIDNTTSQFQRLRPGMNVTCEFVVANVASAVQVPTEAVREDDNGTYVQVATGGTPSPTNRQALTGVRTERRTVELGIEGNTVVEIKSGLKAGEKVVVQTIDPAAARQQRPVGTGGSPFAGSGGMGGGFGGGRGGRGR